MESSYRNKYLTALLAFTFGLFGAHRFYLRERGNGIAYFVLLFVGISPILALIDTFAFLFMDSETFDRKYNGQREIADFDRRAYREYRSRNGSMRKRRPEKSRIKRRSIQDQQLNHLLRIGKEHYDEFDYFEAIACWEKITTSYPGHAAAHYNLACAYSLLEDAPKSFFHLEQAVTNGFKNITKIKTQDTLAYLRIQDSYEDFQKNGFQSASNTLDLKEETKPSAMRNDLIEQLHQLGQLLEIGALTNEEFLKQKKKLIN